MLSLSSFDNSWDEFIVNLEHDEKKDVKNQKGCKRKRKKPEDKIPFDENAMDLNTKYFYQQILNNSSEDEIKHVVKLSETERDYSGRTFNYYLTHYCQPMVIDYWIHKEEKTYEPGPIPEKKEHEYIPFNVYSSYRSNLKKVCGKDFFDPFCRGTPVIHTFSDGTVTILYLRKFLLYKWAYRNHVLTHLDRICHKVEKRKKKKVIK